MVLDQEVMNTTPCPEKHEIHIQWCVDAISPVELLVHRISLVMLLVFADRTYIVWQTFSNVVQEFFGKIPHDKHNLLILNMTEKYYFI